MVKWIHKIGEDIRRILMWLFILLMSAQIIPGIGWMIANIGNLPLFQETTLMIEAAEKLVIDEYMGMLYPLLIVVAKWIAGVIPVPYYTLLYIVQIGTAGFAASYMLKYSGWIKESKGGKIKTVLAVGYLLTFPLLLQMHMAVLPYSLAMSVSIILICDGLYYLRNPQKICGRALIRLCGLWILSMLLLPDYSWLLGVFVTGILVSVLINNKEWRFRILVSLFSTILCFGVIGTTTQTPGSMGRIQKTVGASLVARFVWPNFGRDNYFWNEQIKEVFDYGALEDIAKYPECVIYQFGPGLEAQYGRETANALYWEMALTSFQLDTKQILISMSRDFAAYLCPPAAEQVQTADNHSSLLGWNYGRLQEAAPLLTKYYVNMSFVGWNVLCILGLGLILLQKQKRKKPLGYAILFLSALFTAIWYTMQGAGIQDYKKVMLITFLWLLPIVKGLLLTEKNVADEVS